MVPRIVGVFTAALLLVACQRGAAEAKPSQKPPRPGAVHAPELEGEWLGSDRPLKLSQELKGRVVLVDFWTYCCINCMHTLPILRELEERLSGEAFQVVGVHSGKFEA